MNFRSVQTTQYSLVWMRLGMLWVCSPRNVCCQCGPQWGFVEVMETLRWCLMLGSLELLFRKGLVQFNRIPWEWLITKQASLNPGLYSFLFCFIVHSQCASPTQCQLSSGPHQKPGRVIKCWTFNFRTKILNKPFLFFEKWFYLKGRNIGKGEKETYIFSQLVHSSNDPNGCDWGRLKPRA